MAPFGHFVVPSFLLARYTYSGSQRLHNIPSGGGRGFHIYLSTNPYTYIKEAPCTRILLLGLPPSKASLHLQSSLFIFEQLAR